MIVGLAALAILLALPVWALAEGLLTGVIRARGRYSRTKDPFDYWYRVGFYVVIIAIVVWFGAQAVLASLQRA